MRSRVQSFSTGPFPSLPSIPIGFLFSCLACFISIPFPRFPCHWLQISVTLPCKLRSLLKSSVAIHTGFSFLLDIFAKLFHWSVEASAPLISSHFESVHVVLNLQFQLREFILFRDRIDLYLSNVRLIPCLRILPRLYDVCSCKRLNRWTLNRSSLSLTKGPIFIEKILDCYVRSQYGTFWA